MLTFYLFVGEIPLYLTIIYCGLLILCIILFHKRLDHIDFQLDFRKMFTDKHFFFFGLFIFVYFSLLSLSIGYLRSELRQTYDFMEIDKQKYYILTTNGDKSYIMGEKIRDNHRFLFFNRETKEHYQIHVIKIKS